MAVDDVLHEIEDPHGALLTIPGIAVRVNSIETYASSHQFPFSKPQRLDLCSELAFSEEQLGRHTLSMTINKGCKEFLSLFDVATKDETLFEHNFYDVNLSAGFQLSKAPKLVPGQGKQQTS